MSPQWIVVIVLIAAVYFIFIKKKPAIKQNKKDSTDKKTQPQSNDMIECAECGIYCEVDDTILSNNKHYCSQECLKKA
ncbi:PP0621 family protein [Sulfurimonas sp.]|uniref:PP0621 family protein n=1 Tax=Sulfurimonas sp. TaxID=2022749 RepID=UPI0025D7FC22|nr:PP0621 family protein [Sulfurimonas sp.]